MPWEAPGEPLSRQELERLTVRLLALPPERRHLVVCNVEGYRRFSLCLQLFELGYALRHGDAAGMRVYCQAAVDVGVALPERGRYRPAAEDLRAEAWAHLANAYKVLGDHRAAGQAWVKAKHHRTVGTRDPLLSARLAFLESSFRREHHQNQRAAHLAQQAGTLFRSGGDLHSQALALALEALAHRRTGHLEGAIRCLRRAQDGFDPGQDPSLYLGLQSTLGHFLGESGLIQQGLYLLSNLPSAEIDPSRRSLLIRRRWHVGLLAALAGDHGFAALTLDAVRREFLRRDALGDAALSTLELAAVCLRQGRAAEVHPLVEELFPLYVECPDPQAIKRLLRHHVFRIPGVRSAAELITSWLDEARREHEAAAGCAGNHKQGPLVPTAARVLPFVHLPQA